MWLDDTISRNIILLSFMEEIRNNATELIRIFYKLKQVKSGAKS